MAANLHLLKLCVGADSVEDLRRWQAQRHRRAPRGGRRPAPFHVTRMWPKRGDELLDGGSLYWVFKGLVLARQRILGLEPRERRRRRSAAAPSGSTRRSSARCRSRAGRSRAGATCAPQDAPRDLSRPGRRADLPPALAAELAEIGVL